MKHIFRILILLVMVATARAAIVANPFTTNTPTGITNVAALLDARYYIETLGGHCNGRVATGLYTTNGQRQMTVTKGAFVSGDVGKVIMLSRAGGSFSPYTNSMDAESQRYHYNKAATNGVQGRYCWTTIITNVVSATVIQVSNAAPASVVNEFCVYGTDDTIPINLAIATCVSNGGGTIVGHGISIVNGPVIDQNPTNSKGLGPHKNSQLIFPEVCPASSQEQAMTVRFEGLIAPAMLQSQPTGFGSPTNFGWCIWSTIPVFTNSAALLAGQPTNCAFFASGPSPFILDAGIRFESSRMMWRGCWDNNGTILDLQAFPTVSLEHSSVGCGYPLYYTNQPLSTNSFAIKLAGGNSGGIAYLRDIVIQCFYNGLGIGEHVDGDGVQIYTCWNGINLWDSGGHANGWGYMDIEDVHNYWVNEQTGNGSAVANYATFTTENFFRDSWSKGGQIIYDPGRSMGGVFHIELPDDQDGNPGVSNKFEYGIYPDYGGTQIWMEQLKGGVQPSIGQNISMTNARVKSINFSPTALLDADSSLNTGAVIDPTIQTWFNHYTQLHQADMRFWDGSLPIWLMGYVDGADDNNGFAPRSSWRWQSQIGNGFNVGLHYIHTNGDCGTWGKFITSTNAGSAFVGNAAGVTNVYGSSYSNYTTAATARTMNTWAGKVNLSAGQTTYTVTDSLVASTSSIMATINTADATATFVRAIPGSGSFTLVTTATTGNTSISWWLIQQ